MRNVILIIALSFSTPFIHTQTPAPKEKIGDLWRKVNAEGHFTFRVPNSMKLRSEERCLECAWGSTFSDSRIRLHAEYSDWNEEYADHYLAKQQEYVKDLTEIDGKSAKIQSWRSEGWPSGFSYFAEVRFYDANKKLIARLSARCKQRQDVETAKQIFRSVDFPN